MSHGCGASLCRVRLLKVPQRARGSMSSAYLQALALLIAANAAPVVLSKLMRERTGTPLDFGCVLPDGERLFGDHKTWRGLFFGIVASTLVSGVLGLAAWIGAGFAAASLIGDALS